MVRMITTPQFDARGARERILSKKEVVFPPLGVLLAAEVYPRSGAAPAALTYFGTVAIPYATRVFTDSETKRSAIASVVSSALAVTGLALAAALGHSVPGVSLIAPRADSSTASGDVAGQGAQDTSPPAVDSSPVATPGASKAPAAKTLSFGVGNCYGDPIPVTLGQKDVRKGNPSVLAALASATGVPFDYLKPDVVPNVLNAMGLQQATHLGDTFQIPGNCSINKTALLPGAPHQ